MKMLHTAAIATFTMLLLSGCSGKQSILVPGQSEGDCDARAQKLGVCGTPKAIYEHRDAIKHIYFEEDEAYRVSKNGKIYNIETGEEVIPGQKPDSCGLAVCPGCENEGAQGGVSADGHGTSTGGYSKPGKNDGIRLQNRSLVIGTQDGQTPIRDLGLIQKLWIAPHENAAGDLISAHTIHVVVREPSWIVGEEQPKRTRNGVIIPSPVATSIFTDSHDAISRHELKSIDDFIQEDGPDLSKIEEFLDKNSNNMKSTKSTGE